VEKTTILLVDDHPIIGEGLEFFLNLDPNLEVIGTASNAMAGLTLLKKLHPNVVVLDLEMPDMDGLEAISLYRGTDPKISIIVFSAHTEEKFVYQSLFAGARGYVVKGASPDDLKQAINLVQRGGFWVSTQFSRNIIENYLKSHQEEDPEDRTLSELTEREKQVFRLIVAGKQTEEIGESLYISVNTVAKHRTSLMKKLGVDNVVDLTKLAIRHGITRA